MDHVLQRMREANDLVYRAGPYVLLEILLPGGTLFALLLFLYRRHHPGPSHGIGFAWARGRVDEMLDLRIVTGSRLAKGERDGLEALGL